MAHVRTLVVWNRQVLLVQHHDPRDDTVFWILPGGGSEDGETIEEAARREVKEETGVDVRILRQVSVAPERGYLLFVAEVTGVSDVTPELEACEGESHTVGAAWHPVTQREPLGPMEPDYWSELAPLIRERLRGNPSD
jgi:ADP-ribose pyrophosphatase YjhB (NUDIX family)